MLKVFILFVCVVTVLGGYNDDNNNVGPLAWWDTDDNKEYKERSNKRVPFPQCLVSGSKSKFFESSTLQKLFDERIREEERSLKYERDENNRHGNDGYMDYNAYGSQKESGKSRSAAAAAIAITRDIMTVLACDLNGTDSRNINKFLKKFKLPKEFCSYHEEQNCEKKKLYRTVTGVCNNLERPYEGSSQTAFGRLVDAVYEDHLSEPRRTSCRGGKLPSCRRISLALGSKPLFDRNYNNFFVVFGQFIGHDIALSTPVTDTYLTPISSCTCNSKRDWNKCTVVDIEPDDPFMGGQKCMAFPATAQAFQNQICTLGVKEQLNGNTAFIDLSILYGSTENMAGAVRSHDGLLKSTRRNWAKHEMCPGQREGKSCSDASKNQPCLTGGDSRVMINLVFAGIQSMFLRAHNDLAEALHALNTHWKNDRLYEEARKINIAFFQQFTYDWWLPILFGKEGYKEYFENSYKNKYDPDISPVTLNEAATAAFRCHTLVRDLFSRCTPDGKRIDQLWFTEISHKVKYAYDVENNGLDSLICGSLYDYGFAHDGNFAHQIKNRLFETSNGYKQLWRNDLIAINICRGREHGIAPYNVFREYCSYPKAHYFEDFGDTINYDGIKLLQKLYKHPDDVDLFVALNLEDRITGGFIGPISACILAKQFVTLRDGDRFFYTHHDVFEKEQLKVIQDYPPHCSVCAVVDIDQVPYNPFKPPNESDNQLQDCKACKQFDFQPWLEKESVEENPGEQESYKHSEHEPKRHTDSQGDQDSY